MRTTFPLAAAALAVATALSAHATPYSSIVVFGDSLSDNGNLYQALGGLYPATPYYQGRFSNGPVAVEQLASLLNAPLSDFAYGGATTGVGNITDNGTTGHSGVYGLPGMQAEVLGAAGKFPAAIIPSSLFVVWGGANDYEALSSPTVGQSQTAAFTAAANITGIVTALKSVGATNILVPNLPDLSKTPEFYNSNAASAYTNTFNNALAGALPMGATLFDTNALFTSVLADPTKYGFTNTTSYCTQDLAFPQCTGYLFFDQVHPTTAVDTLLAEGFASAVTTTAATPEPSSLWLLGTGVAGAFGVLRKRKRSA